VNQPVSVIEFARGSSLIVAETAPTLIHGVRVASTGSAIVTVELSGTYRDAVRRCVGIERLPFDIARVADRIEALELGPKDLVVVDGEGAGGALWIAIGSPRSRHFKLYEPAGRERQKLVDPVPAMVRDGTFTFAPDLPHQDAMTKALVGYQREVKDDGVIGSELAVALFLALSHRPIPVARVY
jgi:hypothetical protein